MIQLESNYFLILITNATASDNGINPSQSLGLTNLTGFLISFLHTSNRVSDQRILDILPPASNSVVLYRPLYRGKDRF